MQDKIEITREEANGILALLELEIPIKYTPTIHKVVAFLNSKFIPEPEEVTNDVEV